MVALYSRIKFVRVLYQVLTMLIQRKEDMPVIVDCHRLLAAASDMLFIMKKTVNLGIQPNPGKILSQLHHSVQIYFYRR